MKRLLAMLALVLALGLVAAYSRATPASASGRLEDQIMKEEHDWLDAEANADTAVLQGLIADDFMGTSMGGGVLTKDDIVPPGGGPRGRMPKSSLKDPMVRVYGDTAVLIGYIEFENLPAPVSRLRVTSVYQKRGKGWHMIAAHMSTAPAIPTN